MALLLSGHAAAASESPSESKESLRKRQTQQEALLRERRLAAALAEKSARQAAARRASAAARSCSAAEALRETGARVAALQADIASLTARQDDIRADIARRNRALNAVIPVAAGFSDSPETALPEAALLAAPVPPRDALTGLSIISGIARLNARDAAGLHAEDERLAALGKEQAARRAELAALLDDQTKRQGLAEEQARAARQGEAASRQAAEHAREALAEAAKESAALSAAIDALAAAEEKARKLAQKQARTQPPSPGSGVTSGSGRGPVAGAVTIRWAEATEAGPATGITYAAAPSATVRAPCTGRILFSGPFRSFGRMLILDCGRDYRFVLSGLGTLTVASGQNVRRAAAVGAMPAGGGALFVQLRRGSRVVDPSPFL